MPLLLVESYSKFGSTKHLYFLIKVMSFETSSTTFLESSMTILAASFAEFNNLSKCIELLGNIIWNFYREGHVNAS